MQFLPEASLGITTGFASIVIRRALAACYRHSSTHNGTNALFKLSAAAICELILPLSLLIPCKQNKIKERTKQEDNTQWAPHESMPLHSSRLFIKDSLMRPAAPGHYFLFILRSKVNLSR